MVGKKTIRKFTEEDMGKNSTGRPIMPGSFRKIPSHSQCVGFFDIQAERQT